MVRVLSPGEYLESCQQSTPRLDNLLYNWDRLYRHHRAELCERRRNVYRNFYNVDISERSSLDLCLSERYTACVNFQLNDSTVHICDILPIVIGSELDREIRVAYWERCDNKRCRGFDCDARKRGLIVQNKNYYHITVTMATNPKVAHIYRKSNKTNQVDSRVYYYDRNFRGNMFYFKKFVLLVSCANCAQYDAPCCGRMRLVVVEEIYLRNCFKQDYLLLRRLCSGVEMVDGVQRDNERVSSLLVKFMLQFRYMSEKDLVVDRSIVSLLELLGPCHDVALRCKNLTVKSHDFSLETDLAAFFDTTHDSGDRPRLIKIHVTLHNGRQSDTTGLVCNCTLTRIRESFDLCIEGKRGGTIDGPREERSKEDSHCVTFVDNLQEFRKISLSCFTLDDQQTESSDDHYVEQLYTLYIYMRSVIERNEDIDQLSNKCVFDGPYLYNKLLTQLREYLHRRFSFDNPKNLLIDTLVCRYRQLAHTANLYMLISSKTNIRVELANDMKRSLKLSVKREKMQQADYQSLNNSTSPSLFNSSSLSAVMASVFSVAPNVLTRPNDLVVRTTGRQSTVTTNYEDCDGNEANEKCDFVVLVKPGRRKATASAKTQSLSQNINTEFVVPRKLYVASCGQNDFIVRQLITYSGNYLLQNVSAAHFTDLEFIFETVKRPNVANQHNSIKCSFMPRNSIRFLSYYNMGNLSSAGRTLNVCYRNKITFFLNYERIGFLFHRWVVRAVDVLSLRSSSTGRKCVEHGVQMCQSCLRSVLVNEVPVPDLFVDRHDEIVLFFVVKMFWPAAQFYRKSDSIISITLISGIIMMPMVMQSDTRPLYPRIDCESSVAPLLHDVWVECRVCGRYFPHHLDDRCSNVVRLPEELVTRHIRRDTMDGYRLVEEDNLLVDLVDDGGLVRCSRHLWFSSNDLEYYETYVSASRLSEPFVYEIACHGLLLNCNFMHSTDISKLTVSINASRRRLRANVSGEDPREMEMLIDQNSRLTVRSWSVDEDSNKARLSVGSFDEPLREIIQLPNSHNMFRCCFMFGDYCGLNVEDAYVFDKNSRPLFDNVVQLKMNFYRNDKLLVTLDTLRVHFKPVLNVHAGGVMLYLCALISNHKLSFGSTFVHVKIVRIGECLWLYKFYYVNYSSYLREDQHVFAGFNEGGCEFVEFKQTQERTSYTFEPCGYSSSGSPEDAQEEVCDMQTESSSPSAQNTIRMLFDETATTRNGNVSVRCQMTNKQLRFLVTFRRITSVVKWQNNCGNKGVSSCVDLSDLYTERGGRVHVIVSAYSSIGRQLVAQILEQNSNAGDAQSYEGNLMRVYSRKENGRPVGYCGYGNFFFSCDSPHDTIIASSPSYGNNATRMCNMTYFAAVGNNLSTWIGNRSANHVSYKNNPVNGMPINLSKCLSVYHSYNRQLYMRSLRVRELRKKNRDHVELRERGINSRLPASITCDQE